MAGIKKTPQVYLFYGEESYLVQKMAANLVESLLDPSEREFNLTSLEADPTIGELLHLVESAPFFGERKIVLVRNSKLFQAPRRRSATLSGMRRSRATISPMASSATAVAFVPGQLATRTPRAFAACTSIVL